MALISLYTLVDCYCRCNYPGFTSVPVTLFEQIVWFVWFWYSSPDAPNHTFFNLESGSLYMVTIVTSLTNGIVGRPINTTAITGESLFLQFLLPYKCILSLV